MGKHGIGVTSREVTYLVTRSHLEDCGSCVGGGAYRCPPKVPLLFGRKRTSRVMGDREIFQEEGDLSV